MKSIFMLRLLLVCFLLSLAYTAHASCTFNGHAVICPNNVPNGSSPAHTLADGLLTVWPGMNGQDVWISSPLITDVVVPPIPHPAGNPNLFHQSGGSLPPPPNQPPPQIEPPFPPSSSGIFWMTDSPPSGGCLITNVKGYSGEACTAIKDKQGHVVAYGGGGGNDTSANIDNFPGGWVDPLFGPVSPPSDGTAGLSSGIPDYYATSYYGSETYSDFINSTETPPGTMSLEDWKADVIPGSMEIGTELSGSAFGQGGQGEFVGTPADSTPAPLQVADLNQPLVPIAGDSGVDGGGGGLPQTQERQGTGATTVTDASGATTTTWPDGRTDVTYSDGSRSQYDPATGTTVTTTNGWARTDTPDGKTIMTHSDGSPGWTSTTDNKTGTTEWTHTDGSHYTVDGNGNKVGFENNADGSKTIYNADGTRTNVPAPAPPQPPQSSGTGDPQISHDANGNTISKYANGATITDFKNGGSSIDYGNGTVESKDANGNKTLTTPGNPPVTQLGKDDPNTGLKAGDIVQHSADGSSTSIKSADGSRTENITTQGGVTTDVVKEPGKTTVTVSQGNSTTTIEQTPEGSTRTNMTNGQVTSTEKVDYQTNTKTVEYPNGAVTTDTGNGTKVTTPPTTSEGGGGVPQTQDRGNAPAPGTGTTTGPAAGGSGDDPTVSGKAGGDIVKSGAEETLKRTGLPGAGSVGSTQSKEGLHTVTKGGAGVDLGKTGETVGGQVASGYGVKIYDTIDTANNIAKLGKGMQKDVDRAVKGSKEIGSAIEQFGNTPGFNRPDAQLDPRLNIWNQVRDSTRGTLDGAKEFVTPTPLIKP